MIEVVDVDSGHVAACRGTGILRAGAIGSCVVAVAFDPRACVGGMAHVMLPGSARDPTLSAKTEYSLNAIPELIRKMSALGADVVTLRVCLIGGGNLLGPGYESPGAETVSSLLEVLHEVKLGVVAKEVGGTQRRSCCLNVATGRVSYTVGESERLTLWEPGGE